MSTNAVIAVKQGDQYNYVNLHFDGYVDHAGKMLLKLYNSEAEATALVARGDLRCLGETAAETQDYYTYNGSKRVVYTGRDIAQIRLDTFASYVYVWENGAWYVAKMPNPSTLRKLSTVAK